MCPESHWARIWREKNTKILGGHLPSVREPPHREGDRGAHPEFKAGWKAGYNWGVHKGKTSFCLLRSQSCSLQGEVHWANRTAMWSVEPCAKWQREAPWLNIRKNFRRMTAEDHTKCGALWELQVVGPADRQCCRPAGGGGVEVGRAGAGGKGWEGPQGNWIVAVLLGRGPCNINHHQIDHGLKKTGQVFSEQKWGTVNPHFGDGRN